MGARQYPARDFIAVGLERRNRHIKISLYVMVNEYFHVETRILILRSVAQQRVSKDED
jgi:hypothetical protein